MISTIAATATTAPDRLQVRVKRKQEIAEQIFLFELARDDSQMLPPFNAGSHIMVCTPNGLERRYSLCNAPSERDRYVIAVKRDAMGGSGSISMADDAKVGDQVSVSAPLNYFPLETTTSPFLLIAGGIGITPVLAMMHELRARNASFKVIYCTRSASTTAFMDELTAPEWVGQVLIHHDHGDPSRSLALGPLLDNCVRGTHLYCCGPRPLMQAVRDLTKKWPPGSVHFEDFGTSAHTPVASDERGFVVRLARSGITAQVPPGTTILEALRAQGVSVPSSCEAGTCGSCRTRLISGEAEHRDFVLDDDEHNTDIMICVSRARSEVLVFDL